MAKSLKNVMTTVNTKNEASPKGNTYPSLDRWGEMGLQALKDGIAENEQKVIDGILIAFKVGKRVNRRYKMEEIQKFIEKNKNK